MAYEKTTWVNGETKLSADNFNHMEEGIASSFDEIASAEREIGSLREEIEGESGLAPRVSLLESKTRQISRDGDSTFVAGDLEASGEIEDGHGNRLSDCEKPLFSSHAPLSLSDEELDQIFETNVQTVFCGGEAYFVYSRSRDGFNLFYASVEERLFEDYRYYKEEGVWLKSKNSSFVALGQSDLGQCAKVFSSPHQIFDLTASELQEIYDSNVGFAICDGKLWVLTMKTPDQMELTNFYIEIRKTVTCGFTSEGSGIGWSYGDYYEQTCLTKNDIDIYATKLYQHSFNIDAGGETLDFVNSRKNAYTIDDPSFSLTMGKDFISAYSTSSDVIPTYIRWDYGNDTISVGNNTAEDFTGSGFVDTVTPL